MSDKLPPWRPANYGGGKMIWFLFRGEEAPLESRYLYNKSGSRLVRYASMAAAQKAADKLNREESSQ